MASAPNILLLFTDQQRFDTIAALGNPIIRTPALDQLVAEGTTFTQAFTPSPVCAPARCALSTGLPPHQTTCVDNHGLPPGLPSFMEALQGAGYQTHGVGKMHFDPDFKQLWGFESRDISEEGHDETDFKQFLHDNGHGHVLEVNGLRSENYYLPQPSQLPAAAHETCWVADRSIDFLKHRDRDRPFFLWSSFIKPHPPFENPVPWNRLYRAAEMPAPFRPDDFEDALTYWNRIQNRYKYRDHGYDELLMRAMKAAYYACISFVDQQVARILAALGDEAANTLVVFSSDHGELLGDYGSVGKRCMLDAAARVPLIVRWPGHMTPGAKCEHPVSLLDLAPTFLRAAGVESWRVSAEGDDLLAIATHESKRTYVTSQFSTGPAGLYMITDGHWKYIYSAADQKEWLYDRTSDPQEMSNQAGNATCGAELTRLRDAIMDRLRGSTEDQAVDGEKWRNYGVRDPLPDGDYGLLYQDPSQLQELINALGPGYAREVTPPEPQDGSRILIDLTPPPNPPKIPATRPCSLQ